MKYIYFATNFEIRAQFIHAYGFHDFKKKDFKTFWHTFNSTFYEIL